MAAALHTPTDTYAVVSRPRRDSDATDQVGAASAAAAAAPPVRRTNSLGALTVQQQRQNKKASLTPARPDTADSVSS